ncbi:MAG: HPr kinase/phosphatase C-terminal domain-containing protein [Roseibium sp.]|uniref:HPr kinase/phosphorylase n=1 Tax=Roseibium sp. TaxID=1936156 RepID=UPI001B2D2438|nr:HPr kinase/phosphatase C-terminal domain-containing protein [Roseibium sp.]MBO6891739.1 HPr kinase/phosphatase C-terminal domain-containing protein [Roseibium sp.]MBO6932792.1 HPr kinase/phosphatase C-terminal domain-containing protein [Roseibium sp.]
MNKPSIHANCVIVGTRGLLIRGEAGSGKSELTDTLLHHARERGHLGRLVADDRVVLTSCDDRVLAHVPDTISGQLEVRGHAIVDLPYAPLARLHLIVDLVSAEQIDRLPENPISQERLEGVSLPRIVCPRNDTVTAVRLLRWSLRKLFKGSPDYI